MRKTWISPESNLLWCMVLTYIVWQIFEITSTNFHNRKIVMSLRYLFYEGRFDVYCLSNDFLISIDFILIRTRQNRSCMARRPLSEIFGDEKFGWAESHSPVPTRRVCIQNEWIYIVKSVYCKTLIFGVTLFSRAHDFGFIQEHLFSRLYISWTIILTWKILAWTLFSRVTGLANLRENKVLANKKCFTVIGYLNLKYNLCYPLWD